MHSAKNHGGDIFQGKGLDAGQGLPHRDWEGVLPTQAVLNSNLVTPENFKSYSWFSLTQMDIQTRHTNKSPHHPIWVWAEIFYTPSFLPLSKLF